MSRVQLIHTPTCFLVNGDGVRLSFLSKSRAKNAEQYANGNARDLYRDAYRAVRIIARGGAWSRLHYEQREIPVSVSRKANISFNARRWQ